MMTLPERGLLNAVAIYAGVCVIGLLSLAWRAGSQALHCLAYGAAGVVFAYLVNRFVVRKVNYLRAQHLANAGMRQLMPILLISAVSLYGFFDTMTTGRPNGWMYIVFIMLGGELAEYRKIRVRGRP